MYENRPVARELLDLSKRHATFVRGEITAIITWTLDDQRPCLALIPTLRLLHFDTITPCVVKDLTAWAWSEDKRLRDIPHVAFQSMLFANDLGLSATPASARKVATVIHDLLDDLLMCPPMPQNFDKFIVGASHFRNLATGEVIEKDIKADV
jgi:hypothetical protein